MRIAEVLDFLKGEGIPFAFLGKESDEVERFSSLAHYKSGTFTWVKEQEKIPDGFDLSQIALEGVFKLKQSKQE